MRKPQEATVDDAHCMHTCMPEILLTCALLAACRNLLSRKSKAPRKFILNAALLSLGTRRLGASRDP